MGRVIKCKNEQLLQELIENSKKGQDIFIFMISNSLISLSKKQKKHVTVLNEAKSFVPPVSILSYLINDGDIETYNRELERYYRNPILKSILNTAMVKVTIPNSLLVIFSTHDESQYGYFKELIDNIEMSYGIDIVSIKKYLKNPSSVEDLSKDDDFIIRVFDYEKMYSKKIDEQRLLLDRKR